MLRASENPDIPSGVLVRYAFAVGAVAIAVLLRFVLQSVVIQNEAPYLLLFASLLASAAYGGLGPGILATLLGAAASSVSFQSPSPPVLDLRLLLFLVEGLFVSVLGASLQAARRRAEQSEAQARRLEQKILDISDEERRRFGQDLHDGLGQHLTGVAFLSKALQQRLAAKSLPEAADATKIAALVSESIGQTRALAKGLAPVGLEDGGLTSALAQLATSTSSVFGIECICHFDENLDISELAIATHLYRIVQEAINNAIRHGKAKRIAVAIDVIGRRLQLCVDDDGIGIEPRTSPGGLGLQIMNFRARMIGGALDVQRRAIGAGTVVTCTLPLPREVLD